MPGEWPPWLTWPFRGPVYPVIHVTRMVSGGGAIRSPMWAPKSTRSQGLTVSDLADRKGVGKLHETALGAIT